MLRCASLLKSVPLGTVHVWRVHLGAGCASSARRVLSYDEKQRADRFLFDSDRKRFVIAHAAMREILALYLGIAPQDISFNYSSMGKPALGAALDEGGLKFNLSHSCDWALFAVTRQDLLGVDLEYIDRSFPVEAVADRFLSPGELVALRTLRPQERHEAFFNCWTRKEAFIKAVGSGLSLALDSFDVAFGPRVPASLLRVGTSPQDSVRWSMYDLPVLTGYAAALVIEGKNHRLEERYWR